MKISREAVQREKSFFQGVFMTISFTMKIFLRGRIGGENIKWYMLLFAPVYTWLFFTFSVDEQVIRYPTFNFDLWGANLMTLKEAIIYIVPLLCLYQWYTRGRFEEVYERGESLFWESMESETLSADRIRQWLDPLLPLVLASLFYFIDIRLFLFFAIGGIALWIEEAIFNYRELRHNELQAGNIGRERRRRGQDPKGRKKQGREDVPRVVLVRHEEQEEYRTG